ncbi:hypothetical protein [Streptomyces sp. NPDC017230]|uniref:hypothetical protein n=1 Tax=unclassified Streptomyces TaxID=2593676 RepID=UPI003795C0CE
MDTIVGEIGPKLLAQLAEKPDTAGRLKLYRAMSLEEAVSVMKYWGGEAPAAVTEYIKAGGATSKGFKTQHTGMTIGKHLGDKGQAETYHKKEGEGYVVLVEFTLKPGAHELLFDSDYMALGGDSHKSELIRTAKGGNHPEATGNEGLRPGYIGIKPEDNEPFSLSIAQGAIGKRGREAGPSQLLFQLFVESVRVVSDKTKTLPLEESATV